MEHPGWCSHPQGVVAWPKVLQHLQQLCPVHCCDLGLSLLVRKELLAEAAASERELPTEEQVGGAAAPTLCRAVESPKPSSAQLSACFCLLQDLSSSATEGAAAPSVSGVYFLCPLTGAVVRKDEKEKHLREAIQSVSTVPAGGLESQSCGEPGWKGSSASTFLLFNSFCVWLHSSAVPTGSSVLLQLVRAPSVLAAALSWD